MLQVNQHVHRELMPHDKHLMGQGNLQVDLREKKKRDEKKCNPNDVSLKVAIKAIKASYKSHY